MRGRIDEARGRRRRRACSIGDEGAAALGELLKASGRITSLNVSNNNIGDAGAKALAEALKTNISITSLDMVNNVTDYDGCVALAEALAANQARPPQPPSNSPPTPPEEEAPLRAAPAASWPCEQHTGLVY